MKKREEICWVCADTIIKELDPEFKFLFCTSVAGTCDYCGSYSRVNTYELIKPMPEDFVKKLKGDYCGKNQ